jgi:DNA-binding XRE family transcriptional regulator
MDKSNGLGPVVQRRRLRGELRRIRQEAGETQEQVAVAMDWSLSKLIRIENGTVGISTNDLKVCPFTGVVHWRQLTPMIQGAGEVCY